MRSMTTVTCFVTGTSVPPNVLMHTDDGHVVGPCRVVDQDPRALDEVGVVGGVPRDPEPFGDPGDSAVSTASVPADRARMGQRI